VLEKNSGQVGGAGFFWGYDAGGGKIVRADAYIVHWGKKRKGDGYGALPEKLRP